jgi:hypothetical protein
MPFVLLIIGVVLLVAAVRNTQGNLYTLVQGDFTGQNNFVFWLLAMFIVGGIGYFPKLKSASTAMLGLVIIVLFIKRGNPSGVGGGFFSQFTSAINTTATASPSALNTAAATGTTPATATNLATSGAASFLAGLNSILPFSSVSPSTSTPVWQGPTLPNSSQPTTNVTPVGTNSTYLP